MFSLQSAKPLAFFLRDGVRTGFVKYCVCVYFCAFVCKRVMLCLPSVNQCYWRKGCWDSSTIPNRKWSSDLGQKCTTFLLFSLTRQKRKTPQIFIQIYPKYIRFSTKLRSWLLNQIVHANFVTEY